MSSAENKKEAIQRLKRSTTNERNERMWCDHALPFPKFVVLVAISNYRIPFAS